jgi:DNA-binding NarL/FixJ family response regulator
MLADYPDRVVVTALAGTRSVAAAVDVILYDTLGLHDPDSADGAELEHLVHRTGAKVLVLGSDMRPDLRTRALAMGGDAWISMSSRAADIVVAIERTAFGRPLPERPERLGVRQRLTPRQVDTAALIAQGLSNEEICERLHLSLNTLKSHIRELYRKIGAANRGQAVAWALQHGFAGPDL